MSGKYRSKTAIAQKTNICLCAKLLLFVLSLTLFLLCVVSPQYSTEFTAALQDKYDYMRSIDGPKIILCGSSNTAFGVDSEMLGQAFDMPVVNIGMHGGLGETISTDLIRDYIGAGDVIILLPTTFEENAKIQDCTLAWVTLENRIDMLMKIDSSNYPDMLAEYPNYLKKALNLWLRVGGNQPYGDICYKRDAFNVMGDNIFPRSESIVSEDGGDGGFRSKTISTDLVEYWNSYNEHVLRQGAVMYLGSTAIVERNISLYDLDLASLQKTLETELDFQVISLMSDHVYPLNFFYDTYFHLNDFGKVLYTEQLIRDLQKAMNVKNFNVKTNAYGVDSTEIDNDLIVYTGGQSWTLKCDMPAGVYAYEFSGQNLDKAQYVACTEHWGQMFEIVNMELTDIYCRFEIIIPEDAKRVQAGLLNNSNEEVRIDTILLIQLQMY